MFLPPYKQRMSRTEWESLVPPDVAREQCAWERCATVARMENAGLTHKEIAQRFGVSAGRIQQLSRRAKNQNKSPIEKYWGRTAVAVAIALNGETVH